MSYRRTLSHFYKLCRKLDGLDPLPAARKAKRLLSFYYPNLSR